MHMPENFPNQENVYTWMILPRECFTMGRHRWGLKLRPCLHAYVLNDFKIYPYYTY